MIFSSLEFYVFFLIVLVLNWLVLRGENARRWMLLGASYFFYMTWNFEMASLIFISTAIDYVCGLGIADNPDPAIKKRYLHLSLVLNLCLLGTFKYTNFFLSSLGSAANALGLPGTVPVLNIILPIGISFYTFQSMSYTIDVYYGKIEANRSLRDFSLYVIFFPQLIAGPIVRAIDFLPQFDSPRKFSMDNVILGLDQFLLGCLKKLLIADRASIFVDAVYGNPAGFDGLTVWLATVAYAFQIYCDFSGYSDMAIGLARCFDYDLISNFRTPYLSTNISEFWQRWHMSLSTWLRDYLFTPLGGYRGSRLLSYRNLFITMLLGGLWHGAAWTFVVWGAYHGCLLIIRQALKQPLQDTFGRLRGPVSRWTAANASRLLVFLLVCLGWVPFRAQSFGDAMHLLGKMFGVIGGGDRLISDYTLIVVAIMICYDVIAYRLEAAKADVGVWCLRAAPSLRAACYAAAIVALVVFAPHGISPFIYFQF